MSHEFIGTWRVSQTVIAPWVTSGSGRIDRRRYLGAQVRVQQSAFGGLTPLACTGARYERTQTPPEGLFQGNLPKPAATARVLGFAEGPARGVRVTCATGVFELHATDKDHLLLALDNLILTLDRSPGAGALATSPSGVVQRLLEEHFDNRLWFDSSTVRRLQPWLTSALIGYIGAYLDQPKPTDEAPVIDGDPFTDTQEFPTRFAVQRARVSGPRAEVTVNFADGWTAKTLRYQLRRDGGRWRVEDVAYPDSGRLTGLLRDATADLKTANGALPTWASGAWTREASARGLARDSSVTPTALVADYDGDGRDDVAWLVRHRATGARGVLITHAGGRVAQQCGAGVDFGNGGDNFDWMDAWKVIPRRAGPGYSLMVERSEAASARIEFAGGRYRWFQLGD